MKLGHPSFKSNSLYVKKHVLIKIHCNFWHEPKVDFTIAVPHSSFTLAYSLEEGFSKIFHSYPSIIGKAKAVFELVVLTEESKQTPKV